MVLIEPGEIATPIWQKSKGVAERIVAKMPPQATDLYGPAIDFMLKMITNAEGIPADEVAQALIAPRPKTRYVVGKDARIRVWLERLPTRWRDRVIQSQLPEYGG